MRARWLAVVLVSAGLVACDQKPAAAPEPAAAPAPTAAQGAEPAAAEKTPVDKTMLVSVITAVRKVATDDRKIDDPAGGKKKVMNWVATLQRGERVQLVEPCEEWCKVEVVGGETGWVKASHLVDAENLTLATVLDDAPVFRRPDLVALDADRKLEPGTLLFVVREQEGFTEVNWLGQSTVWLQKDKLTDDAREVEASRLLGKVRWMKERKDESAGKLFDLAKEQFGDTRLVTLVSERMAVEAEAEAEAEAGSEDAPAVVE